MGSQDKCPAIKGLFIHQFWLDYVTWKLEKLKVAGNGILYISNFDYKFLRILGFL